jgi:hypothetical protein
VVVFENLVSVWWREKPKKKNGAKVFVRRGNCLVQVLSSLEL